MSQRVSQSKNSNIVRPKCNIEGCNNLSAYNGKTQGYRKLCCSHHRKKYGISNRRRQDNKKKLILNNRCVKCGWNGPCDRHRIEQGGEYKQDNVLVLCPNCHRLLHFKERGYPLIPQTSAQIGRASCRERV